MNPYNSFTNKLCPRKHCGGRLYIEDGKLHCYLCSREWELNSTEVDRKPPVRKHVNKEVQWAELAKSLEEIIDR